MAAEITPQQEPVPPDGRDSFWTNSRLLKLTIFCMIVMLLAIGSFFYVLDGFNHELTRQRINSYENRAMVCRVQQGLEIELPESCTEPNILLFFNPDEDVSNNFRSNLGALLCYIAEEHGGTFPEAC